MDIHQCVVTIDNTQNPYPLTLQSLAGPDGSGSVEGTFGAASPAFGFQKGDMVAARGSLTFTLTGGELDTAGATLVWSTGSDSNASNATVTMAFQNKMNFGLNDNSVGLNVSAGASQSANAQMAYGVSHLYASEGSAGGMGRDYLASRGAAYPVNVSFTVGYNSFVDTPPVTPFLPGITNVVMLMLENRAFDHLLGQIYTADPPVIYPSGSKVPAGHSTLANPINFDGLHNNPDFASTLAGGSSVAISAVAMGALDVPNPDPAEGYLATLQQIYGSTDNPPTAAPTMGGFLSSYAPLTAAKPEQILQYYTPSELTVLSALATSYAVSDAWFASVPSETSPNRAFSLAGTSNGYVNNTKNGLPAGTIFEMLENGVRIRSRTLFNVLTSCGLAGKWAIYYQDEMFGHSLTATLFEQLSSLTSNVHPIADFFQNLKNGTLPAFSYLEPAWYQASLFTGRESHNGNDYHPPANLCEGEAALAYIYSQLTQSRNWDTTLFIVTFDEHGGTFDHVSPPTGVKAPDGQADWSGFGFDRLGVRVPTLLISPRIQAGTVFRSPTAVPFDHTSFLKTLLGWQGIDVSGGVAGPAGGVLGARAAAAPDFSGVLSPTAVNKAVVTPVVSPCPPGAIYDDPLVGPQTLLLPHLARSVSGAAEGSEEHKHAMAEMESIKTLEGLRDYLREKRGAGAKAPT